MAGELQRLDRVELPEIATSVRNAGLAGAGGAGFPTYAKWERLSDADFLLVNHQESEPNYYIDKWLGRDHAREFAALFDALLERGAFEVIVVGAKLKDRDRWMTDLERETRGTVYEPADLPLDPIDESGVVFAYTDDQYEYGMESVLLRMVADVVVGDDLPMDHGWIVQNTETMFDLYRLLGAEEPVTRKLVHVDGNVPNHRFLDVPVGTPAADLLAAAGRPVEDLGDDELLADGGPGWCFEIERSPSEFGVRKRTNCLLVVDADVATENTLGSDRINVISPYAWSGDHETEPTALDVGTVHVPLVTNPAFEGVVTPSEPIVEPGDRVSTGEMIATPAAEGVSTAQHASIDGVVTAVSESTVTIEGESDAAVGAVERTGTSADAGTFIYWTWCEECGEYVVPPADEGPADPDGYVCADCR